MNDNHAHDPHVDRLFATVVKLAGACFVETIFILFPRHDHSMPRLGRRTALAVETPAVTKSP
jgi:hypothetical protein